MKKFRTITLAVALTTALSFGATGALATGTTGTTGTMGTGTTTTSGYTGSNYDATATPPTATTPPYLGTRPGPDNGNGILGQINGDGNNMMDRMSTTGTNTGNYDTSSYRAYATTADDNDMDWGWLGLIGLLGLAGLRGRDKRRDDVR